MNTFVASLMWTRGTKLPSCSLDLNPTPLSHIPIELATIILDFVGLSPGFLLLLREVCKDWRDEIDIWRTTPEFKDWCSSFGAMACTGLSYYYCRPDNTMPNIHFLMLPDFYVIQECLDEFLEKNDPPLTSFSNSTSSIPMYPPKIQWTAAMYFVRAAEFGDANKIYAAMHSIQYVIQGGMLPSFCKVLLHAFSRFCTSVWHTNWRNKISPHILLPRDTEILKMIKDSDLLVQTHNDFVWHNGQLHNSNAVHKITLPSATVLVLPCSETSSLFNILSNNLSPEGLAFFKNLHTSESLVPQPIWLNLLFRDNNKNLACLLKMVENTDNSIILTWFFKWFLVFFDIQDQEPPIPQVFYSRGYLSTVFIDYILILLYESHKAARQSQNNPWIKEQHVTKHKENIKNAAQLLKLTKLAWETQGVRSVRNDIKIKEKFNFKQSAKDVLITSQLRTALIVNKNIKATNYQIDTYKKKIYLYGIALTPEEKDLVISEAKEIVDVEDVIASILLVEDLRIQRE